MRKESNILLSGALPGKALEAFQEQYKPWVWEGKIPLPKEELKKRLPHAEGLMTVFLDKIDEELLEAAPKLKVISNYGVGYSNIDTEACARRNIQVGYTPNVVTEATADQAMALLLAGSRRLYEGAQHVRLGKWKDWSPTFLLSNDVYGKTLGILGMGRIGEAIARRAMGFSMPLLYHSRSRKPEAEKLFGAKYCSLEELFRQSDFLMVSILPTEETRNLVNQHTLSWMKPSAFLVNIARGSVVDTQALASALKNKVLRGAALDVIEPEPPSADLPLLQEENCLIVPHLGTSTWETREKMAKLAVENLLAGLRGDKLPHSVFSPS